MGSAMMAAAGCAVGGVKTGVQYGGWIKGHFQIHFIYTGASESVFLIFPDGTTMLIDCGDFDAASRASPIPRTARKGRCSFPATSARRGARWRTWLAVRFSPTPSMAGFIR